MGTTTRRTALAAATLILLSGVAPAATVAATPAMTTAAATCGVTWGSLAKSVKDARVGDGTITNVRSGRHTCYDRLVVDVAGIPASKIGYHVRYVDTVYAPGSGKAVPLAGGARLQVDLTAPAYNSSGKATYAPRDRAKVVNVTGYDTLRQVAMAGSFEGRTTFGVGVRARLPMRVMVLDGPGTGSRLIIDVAHRW